SDFGRIAIDVTDGVAIEKHTKRPEVRCCGVMQYDLIAARGWCFEPLPQTGPVVNWLVDRRWGSPEELSIATPARSESAHVLTNQVTGTCLCRIYPILAFNRERCLSLCQRFSGEKRK